MSEDFYHHRAIISEGSGRSVLRMRGPFRHDKVYTLTRGGARRVARKWEESGPKVDRTPRKWVVALNETGLEDLPEERGYGGFSSRAEYEAWADWSDGMY